jgi:hypothetical protein
LQGFDQLVEVDHRRSPSLHSLKADRGMNVSSPAIPRKG